MKTETLSEINIKLQYLILNAGCNGGKLNSFEAIEICKEIAKLAEGDNELSTI